VLHPGLHTCSFRRKLLCVEGRSRRMVVGGLAGGGLGGVGDGVEAGAAEECVEVVGECLLVGFV